MECEFPHLVKIKIEIIVRKKICLIYCKII